MYKLFFKQFFRSKTVGLAIGIIIFLGVISIVTGKQFLNQKQVSVTKTIEKQHEILKKQQSFHGDDIGYLTYYLKFSFINAVQPLAGISIGQSDLNSHVQSVGITALEAQKHNTDLVNPMRLQAGNLDVSFLIVFLFPLVIIALCFNLLSEEEETGTWKMITIQAKSSFRFLLTKIYIRLGFVLVALIALLLAAKLVLDIPFNKDFVAILSMSCLYILFWFALCFFVILLRKSSNTNAIVLLTSWLVLVVFLPVLVSNFISSKYPTEEALTMVLKQRDAYHTKWDTDKKACFDGFYEHYPQFKKYGYKLGEDFTWHWYYTMQQMGADESKEERDALYNKIRKREAASRTIAQFFPPMQLQLCMNDIAKTSLSNHVDFLLATDKFHEDLRFDLYPAIFEDIHPSEVDLEKHKPQFFNPDNNFNLLKKSFSMILITLCLLGLGVFIKQKSFS